MPNQETSVDQYRNYGGGGGFGSYQQRKPSFNTNYDYLSPQTGNNQQSSRKSSNASSGTPPKLLKEEVLYEKNNLQLSECTYSDLDGNEKTIPVIHKRSRNQNSKSSTQSGILSIGILKRHILCDCLILVKKYRPSLKSWTLEFPAKIVENTPGFSNPQPFGDSDGGATSDSDSSVGDMAVQNVEENTGYRSTQIQWVSPETAMEPDLSDHKLKLVSVLIDGDDPIRNNFSCQDNSDDSDDSTPPSSFDPEIEVIPVPVNGLLDRLNEYDRQGVVIDARVYAFAIGLKRGEKLATSVTAQPENIEIAL